MKLSNKQKSKIEYLALLLIFIVWASCSTEDKKNVFFEIGYYSELKDARNLRIIINDDTLMTSTISSEYISRPFNYFCGKTILKNEDNKLVILVNDYVALDTLLNTNSGDKKISYDISIESKSNSVLSKAYLQERDYPKDAEIDCGYCK